MIFLPKNRILPKKEFVKLKVDKYGRVVLPKKLRLVLGADNGSEVSVHIDPNSGVVTLLPVEQAQATMRIAADGFPIIVPTEDTPVSIDFVKLIKEGRETRLDQISGL